MAVNQYKKIKINNTEFYLNLNLELFMDLVSEKYKTSVETMDLMFLRDDKFVKKTINTLLKDGCTEDKALNYFIIMALQNYGDFKTASKVAERMFQEDPDHLISKIAYANSLIFSGKIHEISAAFNNNFNLEEITRDRELPLIVFLSFMEIACFYYDVCKNKSEFSKYLSYLEEAAPNHPITQRFIEDKWF